MTATNQDYLEHLFLSQTLTRLADVKRMYEQSMMQLKAAMKGASAFNPKMLEERDNLTKGLAKVNNDIQNLMPIVRDTGLKLLLDCVEKYNIGELQFLVPPVQEEKPESKLIVAP